MSKEYHNEFVKANYYQIRLSLKLSDDCDMLAWLEEQKEWGYPYNEIMKQALRERYEEERKGK